MPECVESNGSRLYGTAAHQYWKSYFFRSPYASSRKRLSSAGCASAAPSRMSAHSWEAAWKGLHGGGGWQQGHAKWKAATC